VDQWEKHAIEETAQVNQLGGEVDDQEKVLKRKKTKIGRPGPEKKEDQERTY